MSAPGTPKASQAAITAVPDLIPLCAHHREVIYNLATKDHVGDLESERAATEMRRQCCGRGLGANT